MVICIRDDKAITPNRLKGCLDCKFNITINLNLKVRKVVYKKIIVTTIQNLTEFLEMSSIDSNIFRMVLDLYIVP